MLKQIKIFPHYKKLNITKDDISFSKRDKSHNYNHISFDNRKAKKYKKSNLNKLTIDTRLNKYSLSLDNSRRDLINTIKKFITEPSYEIYTNKTNITNITKKTNISNLNINPNLNPNKRSFISANNNKNNNIQTYKTDINSNRKNKRNKNRINCQNKLLLKRYTTYYNNSTNNNNTSSTYRLFGNDNNYFDRSITINDENNYTINYENEIEKRIKKIELMKNEINLINNYFNQVNKQLIKVLYNSTTIKAIQKNLDKEIPNIKEEINEIKNKIYLINQEN